MNPILKFEPNRVLRLYHGGSGIDRLRGESNPQDGKFPEDWIASCIEGNGRAYHSPGHGISRVTVDGAACSFPEYLAAHAGEILGREHFERFGAVPGVLVKLLDSAEQLPLQVHPSRADARTCFHSPCGKTEAWIVLSTRKVGGEDPYLLVSFNEKLDPEVFRSESLAGRYDRSLAMFHKLRVAPGDVVMIRGGLPHAIGPGVTMVEVMEPSDLVIVPEIDCCGIKLDEKQRFAGLPPETAMKLFDMRRYSETELRDYCCPKRRTVFERPNLRLTTLIPPEECEYFSAWKLEFAETHRLTEPAGAFRIGIATEGRVEVNGIAVERGEGFLIPHSSPEYEIAGRGEIVLILPGEA